MSNRTAIIIPARLASTRLPEKLLRVAGGKSILQHTFDAARACTVTDDVVVAVDDQRLADEVDSFGGRWIMTGKDCASGTDRIAEVAAAMPEIDVFVNVQGDEPEIDPGVVDLVATALIESSDADMSTAGTPIRDAAILADPSCVKIVMANNSQNEGEPNHVGPNYDVGPNYVGAGQGKAIYFSRAAAPHCRNGLNESILNAEPPVYWHHLGLYAYRRDFLSWFAQQPPSLLEQTEKLEQLRAIEAGKNIVVARVDSAVPGIDTQADFDAFVERLQNR